MQEAAKFGNNRKSPDKINGKNEKNTNSATKVTKKVLNKITDKITEEDRLECDTNNIVLDDLNSNHNNVKDNNNEITIVKNKNVPNAIKENDFKSLNTDVNHKNSPSSDKSKNRRTKSKCKCESKECTCSQSGDDDASPRPLKSGHSRTRAIVINLDDKNRFTEEVTV